MKIWKLQDLYQDLQHPLSVEAWASSIGKGLKEHPPHTHTQKHILWQFSQSQDESTLLIRHASQGVETVSIANSNGFCYDSAIQ